MDTTPNKAITLDAVEIRDEVAARLIDANERCRTVGAAIDELVINYELIAHLTAALGTWGYTTQQDQVLQHFTVNLPIYVAELQLLKCPGRLAPGSEARN